MNVTFYGGVREVTGSMHLIKAGRERILLDCGLFQGRRKESERKNRVLPFDPGIITNVILSHAHIDHSGRLPFLTGNGFLGRIICTRATAAACEYLLLDSAHIQESDAQYLNYKTVRTLLYRLKESSGGRKITHREINEIKKVLKKRESELDVERINQLIDEYQLEGVRPLYTVAEAEKSLDFFEGYPYRHPIGLGEGLTCHFYDAGHILGSAFSVITVRKNGRTGNIFYTGDIGRFGKPIIKDPTLNFDEEHREIELLIMESTYGDRLHEPVRDIKGHLKQILTETIERGGTVVIPSFAFGRTQELIYVLHELYDEGDIPRVPVYIDSPLATKLTKVFGEHPEVYDRETHQTFLEKGKNPFSFRRITFVSSVEESMALMREVKPHVVIASSGMCEGGRILHHLRYKIHNPRNTILIVGYMAENTLGRRLLEFGRAYEESGRQGPAPELKFLNKTYPLHARVVELGGFSAHADKNEILRFLKESNLKIKRIALVHGEEKQSLALARRLTEAGYSASAPRVGETFEIFE